MTRARFTSNLSEKQILEGFEKVSNMGILWFDKAKNLLDASKLLEEHDLLFDAIKTQKGFSKEKLNLMSVILMLRGMGLECLLKGALAKQGKITAKDGKLDVPKEYQQHNLASMAIDVQGLNLTDDELITLNTLSQQITLARLPMKKAPTKDQMKGGGWTAPHDEQVYKVILDKILAV